MPEPEGEMSTPELEAALKRLQELMETQADQRHRANNQLASTLLEMGHRQLLAQENVAGMRADITRSLQMIEDLTARMIGNKELRQLGLVDEVATMHAKFELSVAEMNIKISQAVETMNSTREEFKTWRNRIIGGVGIIGFLGTLISWLQAQFKWPFGSGGVGP